MYIIAVCNPKGGCGKTTIALNLGIFLSAQGLRVRLFDLDEQSSLVDWLKLRPTNLPPLHAQSATISSAETHLARLRRAHLHDVVLFDFPARATADEVRWMTQVSHAILLPTLPSPVDIRALVRHIFFLVREGGVKPRDDKIATLANRVRSGCAIHARLQEDLHQLDFPFLGALRDTQNYSLAAAQGIGIAELPPHRVQKDLISWQPVLSWVFARMEKQGLTH